MILYYTIACKKVKETWMKQPVFHEIAENIYLLKVPMGDIWTGVYLVRRDQNILIDSGCSAADVDNVIVSALRQAGLTVPDIGVLLCTHTHGDHIGGHSRLKELGAGKAGVCSSGADKLRDPLKYSKQIRSVFPEYSSLPPAVLDGVEPELILNDGDEIGGLKILATPGHDSDCVCFFDPAGGILLTGDSLQGNGTDMQGCALYMDLPAYEKTLKRLAALPIRMVVTGHPYHPWDCECVPGGKAVEDCLELLKKYDTFLAEGTQRDPAVLAVSLIRHLKGKIPDKLFLAMYTVREHLKRQGKIAQ